MSLLVNPHCSPLFFSLKPSKFHPNHKSLNSIPFPRRTFSVRSSENPTFTGEDEPSPRPTTGFFNDIDPTPGFFDEPKEGEGVEIGNGSAVVSDDGGEKLLELKRALVDTVYGSDFGYRASAEARAEAIELVSQLEAGNPTPAPTESPELLDGNWILVYTAFSELLPLLAANSLPLVKVEKITQSINTSSLNIENSVTISTPVSSISFSASASFEIRTPSRIQVEFKEGKFNPPEIKSKLDLPESVSVFGQTISLSAVEASLRPLEGVVEGIARSISGQPPLKIGIPGQRAKSWLLTTYLDKDLRISRGDGGIFVLVKEGSPLLD